MSEPDAELYQPTYVIGHRNPDTDAICSAIGYADLLRQMGTTNALAARCGNYNERTGWVLGQAGEAAPRLVMDVRPRVWDLCRRRPITASPRETFLDVYRRMALNGLRSIPVQDDERRLVGVLEMPDLLQLLIPDVEGEGRIRSVITDFVRISEALGGVILNAAGEMDTQAEYLLMVGASSEATMGARMERFETSKLVVLVADRPEIQRQAIETGVGCLVITGGHQISLDLLELAGEKGVRVIGCGHDTGSSVQLIRCSRPVASAVNKDCVQLAPGRLLSDVRGLVQETHQALFPVVKPDTGELVGVFSKSDLISPPRARLVLVDHNEFSQAVSGAESADITEVLDHHRISGNLVSKEPVRFINEPVGSTSTIVARSYVLHGFKPPRGVAVCLCGGLISDTLKLTSPTTTDTDREMLAWLAEVAEIDIEEFAAGFFASGWALRNQTPKGALEGDRKEYNEGGYLVSISQVEELGLRNFDPVKDEVKEALEAIRVEHNCDLAFAMITDITKHFSLLVACGEAPVLEKIDYPQRESGIYEMDGVVSRKKQLFPWLGRLLGTVPRG